MSAYQQITLSNSRSIGFSDVVSSPLTQFQHVQISVQNSGEKVTWMCSFEGMSEQIFSLFKSLLSVGKPLRLASKLDVKQQTAILEFPQDEKEKIERYLNHLVFLIQKEVDFKRVLKEIIANKTRFKAEQVLLQKALFEPSGV